jgi:hypothetical protein
MDLVFGGSLKTGIYYTQYDGSPLEGHVSVSFYFNMISSHLEDGYKVYVNEVSQGHYNVTFCSIPWLFSGSTYANMTASFNVPN